MPASSAQLMVREGGGGGHHNFDACVRGGVSGGRSKGRGASLHGSVCVYEVLPVPSKLSCGGGVC
jgi:hypothetical protein